MANVAYFDVKDEDGRTPLHKAAISGSFILVKQFVDSGANVNIVDKDGKTAFDLGKENILVASYLGHKMSEKLQVEEKYEDALKMYDELLKLQEETLGYDHCLPTKTRYYKGSLQSLLYIMGRSDTKPPSLMKDMDTQNDAEGRTPLHEAAKNGNLNVVKRLVMLGANVLIVDKDGKTAFNLAKNHIEVASFLGPITSKKLIEENKYSDYVRIYEELHAVYEKELESRTTL